MDEEKPVIESKQKGETVEDIDEARKKSVAYEYLCHLEEAKVWLEAVLQEQLPPSVALEEWLRNGVCLAKLGHFIAPQVVPISKIYDVELRRYEHVGLQFSHTDNINYWLKALVATGLPKTFHPETTDVYDKKGMPKVIYCIHALSTHLFKLGKAPLIQDLYGKVKFTDAEIWDMNRALENNGMPMPAFQSIGGLLTKDITDDADIFHDGILEVNESLNKKDANVLIQALGNPVIKISDVELSNAQRYWSTLNNARNVKIQASLNRSASESFSTDVYDEILTQAEIQGHITSVNIARSYENIIDAAVERNNELLVNLLNSPRLCLKSVCSENVSFYSSELASARETFSDCGTLRICSDLQKAVNKGNHRAQHEIMVLNQMEKIERCLKSGTPEELLHLLQAHELNLQIECLAAPLYFEELRADMKETGKLVYEEVKAELRTLNNVAAVTKAIDSGDVNQTWMALSNPLAYFSDLDPHLKADYWQALTESRRSTSIEKHDNCVLSYCDIQICVDSVNLLNKTKNNVIEVLSALNDAVNLRDEEALIKVLQSPVLYLYDVSPHDSKLYLILFEERLGANKGESCLKLEDVYMVAMEANLEAHAAQHDCVIMSQINSAIRQDNAKFTIQLLVDYGFADKDVDINVFSLLKTQREKKMKFKSPWVVHQTKKGHTVFLNMENFSYSWTIDNFEMESQFLSRKEIEMILQEGVVKNTTLVNEQLVVQLQSLIRGYLVRRSFFKKKQEMCAVKIQAWWRGTYQRLKYLDLLRRYQQMQKSLQVEDRLNHYQKEEGKIIKIQALWRGCRARKALVSLFHKTKPSFKVVKQFSPYLNINNDDYAKEILLQNLKAQVTQAIRRNQQLAKQLDSMDIKIGLLVQNRISLQDVMAHHNNLRDLATRTSGETLGLKSLNRESRKRLEGYQHLFYMLQTNPSYLAKLLFCLPKDRTVMFIKTVIWSLFNFGTNLREEYLLLRLFRSALQEEVELKFARPVELMTSTPLVLSMVADYARQAVGPNSLQNAIGPLVQKVLDDKSLLISTNPVDIYKNWRNQEEMKRGVASEFPPSVSPEQALSHPEVQHRMAHSIQALKLYTSYFLDNITQSIKLIPYGLLYMARVLRDSLEKKFPAVPEKDILKVVGNLIYYHYINPAIIGPETYGIITLTADSSLSSVQRLNLASIAKILQFSAVKKGFGEECRHLMCLNNFIIQCHKKFKTFFRDCCNVEDLESHFSLHQYSEATLISRPVIYVTLQEICDTHKLLEEYLDQIAPDSMDPLCELLEDMGPAPTLTTLMGRNPSDTSVAHLAKTEVCLTLVNKFEVPEEDVTDINKLFINTKKLLVSVLPCLKGETLLEALNAPETDDEEEMYLELAQDYSSKRQSEYHKKYISFTSETNLRGCKTLLRQQLSKLELEGLVSKDDHYQTIITAIAHDICNHGRYREIIRTELLTLRATKYSLDKKMMFYEEQVALYNRYIQTCLENLNAGKRNVHSLKNSGNRHKVKSKLVLKYSAARLHDKGILLEVDGLPASQFKNVQFEISPSNSNGIFTICGRFMGVDLEKVDIDIQHLLQLQFDGESVMDIFGKAKINVNLLLHLLNKKFYGRI